MTVPSQVNPAHVVLGTSAFLRVGDRSRTEGVDSVMYNTGAAEVNVGADALARGLVSVGPVLIRERALVGGGITSEQAVARQRSTIVTGQILQNTPVARVQHSIAVEYPSMSQVVRAPRGSVVDVAPGSYSSLRIEAGGVAQLGPGVYFVNSLELEREGALRVTSPDATIVYVRTALNLKGNLEPSRSDHLAFVYTGSAGAFVEGALRGTLLAPSADVTLGSRVAHRGAVWARGVELQPDAELAFEPFVDLGRLISSLFPACDPAIVSDGNPCTLDSCGADGRPRFAPAPSGTSCSDDNACNGVEACDGAGACIASAAPPVDDQNQCTVDDCDPATGLVTHATLPTGAACIPSTAPSEVARTSAGLRATWATPIPVPGLTAAEAQLLADVYAGQLPREQHAALLAKRDEGVRQFVNSSAVRQLVGSGWGFDELVAPEEVVTPQGSSVRFAHDVLLQSNGTHRARALGSSVVARLDSTGSRVREVVSSFAAGLRWRGELRVTTAEARERALSRLQAEGVELDSVAVDQGSIRRVISRHQGTPAVAQMARISDRLQELMLGEFAIDAQDAHVLSAHLPGHHTLTSGAEQVRRFMMRGAFLKATAERAICYAFDGLGADRNGILREFSTSLVPDPSAPEDYVYATYSCAGEAGHLQAGDIVTFHSEPMVSSELEDLVAYFHLGENNRFYDMPWAVDAQYWGQRAVSHMHERGYYHRTAADASGRPARIRALGVTQVDAVGNISFFAPPLNNLGFTAGNGLVLYDDGDTRLGMRSGTDPAMVFHEFAHSIEWDFALRHETAPAHGTEARSISEGFATCYEMLLLHEHQDELSGAYRDLGTAAPFHPKADHYESLDAQLLGYPNLERPTDSAPSASGQETPFSAWAGQRYDGDDADVRTYANSTLFSAPCYALLTGENNLSAPENTNTPNVTHHLGVVGPNAHDENVARERLSELLLAAWSSGRITSSTTFYDLIDVLADEADALNRNRWHRSADMGERVRIAFGEYGWGRGRESEPNDAESLQQSRPQVANLIATDNEHSRPIEGEACCNDEDFFVLNEDVTRDDVVHVRVDHGYEVRLYREQPCAFSDRHCSDLFQIFPVPEEDGSTPPSWINEPEAYLSYTHQVSGPGGVGGGGLPKAQVYVGVRGARSNANPGAYRLVVRVERH